ncbi:unnamed protein product [Fasciola hepatica]|uniref:Uncharacterized protein n=1 Tax=Fasciola hepatica TaxID=6192 RepID=A0ABC9HHJ7_FASHE
MRTLLLSCEQCFGGRKSSSGEISTKLPCAMLNIGIGGMVYDGLEAFGLPLSGYRRKQRVTADPTNDEYACASARVDGE